MKSLMKHFLMAIEPLVFQISATFIYPSYSLSLQFACIIIFGWAFTGVEGRMQSVPLIYCGNIH